MKRSKAWAVLSICTTFAANSPADTNYVSAFGSHEAPYTNWATAAHNIADAVAEAAYGNTIRVTNGTYVASNAIVVSKTVHIKSVNGAAETTIQGTGTDRCLELSASATVDGFTIVNGYAGASGSGGGVLMQSNSKLWNSVITGCLAGERSGGVHLNQGGTITNCQIIGNTAGMEGGGATLYRGGLVQDSFIADNTASNAAGGTYIQSSPGYSSGTIEDCIISNNAALDLTGTTATYEGSGGGIFVSWGGEVRGCTIVDNLASNYGGGVIIVAEGTVQDCLIEDNESNQGGGVCLYEGGLATGCTISSNHPWSNGGGAYIRRKGTVQDCILTGNTTSGNGGGAYTSVSSTKHDCKLIGNVFSGNTAENGGGAYLSAYYGGTYARNCLFTNNTATSMGVAYSEGGGGGLFAYTGGVVENCTIVDNVASNKGGGFRSYGSSGHNPYVYNTIIYSNNAASGNNWSYSGTYFRYCCSTPLLGGEGNIAGAPLLSSSGELLSGSPCIDTGTNRINVVDDIVHTYRPLDGNGDGTAAPDIGAYEFVSVVSDTDGDGQSDYDEIVAGTHPADSNSVFTISYWDSNGVLGWDSVDTRRYFLQTTTNLVSNVWVNVAEYAGTGSGISVTNPPIEPVAFYRLRVERDE